MDWAPYCTHRVTLETAAAFAAPLALARSLVLVTARTKLKVASGAGAECLGDEERGRCDEQQEVEKSDGHHLALGPVQAEEWQLGVRRTIDGVMGKKRSLWG